MLHKHSEVLSRDEFLEITELLAHGRFLDHGITATPLDTGRTSLKHSLEQRVRARDIHLNGAVTKAVDMAVGLASLVTRHDVHRVLHRERLDVRLACLARHVLHSDVDALEDRMQHPRRSTEVRHEGGDVQVEWDLDDEEPLANNRKPPPVV